MIPAHVCPASPAPANVTSLSVTPEQMVDNPRAWRAQRLSCSNLFPLPCGLGLHFQERLCSSPVEWVLLYPCRQWASTVVRALSCVFLPRILPVGGLPDRRRPFSLKLCCLDRQHSRMLAAELVSGCTSWGAAALVLSGSRRAPAALLGALGAVRGSGGRRPICIPGPPWPGLGLTGL